MSDAIANEPKLCALSASVCLIIQTYELRGQRQVPQDVQWISCELQLI